MSSSITIEASSAFQYSLDDPEAFKDPSSVSAVYDCSSRPSPLLAQNVHCKLTTERINNVLCHTEYRNFSRLVMSTYGSATTYYVQSRLV